MNWSLYNHTSSERPAPQLDLLRLYWRIQGMTGKTLACGLYRTAAGLEVRCGYDAEDDFVRSQFVKDIETADQVADTWKVAILAKKRFVELEGEP